MSFNWIKKFGNGLSSTSDIVTPAQNASATQLNIETGVPASQEQDPDGGGQYVKRAEFNGLLQALSLPLFERNGGKQVTFDADYSTQNNGYSIGTVLWCASNNTYQLSLQNNNTANFVTNPNFINDGVNWQNLASAGEFPDIIDNATTGTVIIGGRIRNAYQYLMTSDDSNRRAMIFTGSNPAYGGSQIGLLIENEDRTVNNGIILAKGFIPEVVMTEPSLNRYDNSVLLNGDFDSFFDVPGYITLPVGISKHVQKKVIIQFGNIIFGDIPKPKIITYPIAFPNATFTVILTDIKYGGTSTFSGVYRVVRQELSSCRIEADIWGTVYPASWSVNWIAIGF